jgi:hypothetical protein
VLVLLGNPQPHNHYSGSAKFHSTSKLLPEIHMAILLAAMISFSWLFARGRHAQPELLVTYQFHVGTLSAFENRLLRKMCELEE